MTVAALTISLASAQFVHFKEGMMIQQPIDKLAAARDKREWNEIRHDRGYWEGFWSFVRQLESRQVIVVLQKSAVR